MTSNTPAAPAASCTGTPARSRRSDLGRTALALAGLLAFAAPSPAAEPGLHIELNKVEDNVGSCVASFVVRNALGQTLDRFSLDLYVFDREGIIARQVLLDLAPLRQDKTTVARFALIPRPCADLGRVLVNDIPSCRSEAGETLDCLAGLTVSSRDRIALVK
ncbi:MAG: hypothetical protein ACE5GS_07835 [Kiloniellaceae bacterium]